MGVLLIVLLLVLLLGGLPIHSYSEHWGYAPSGMLGVVLIIILVLVLLGRI